MGILADPMPDMLAMSRFDDGAIDMQELLRRLAEQVVNAGMDAEVDRAIVAAVAEMYATGANARKVQRIAEKIGVPRRSKGQVDVIAASLDADIDQLCGGSLDDSPVPYMRLDVTCRKCRREGRVTSTAVVTAIGCDAGGRRRVLGAGVVDAEPSTRGSRSSGGSACLNSSTALETTFSLLTNRAGCD